MVTSNDNIKVIEDFEKPLCLLTNWKTEFDGSFDNHQMRLQILEIGNDTIMGCGKLVKYYINNKFDTNTQNREKYLLIEINSLIAVIHKKNSLTKLNSYNSVGC